MSLSRDHDPTFNSALERAAQICEQQARDFLSPQYATNQPLGSINERFACMECARAIRAEAAKLAGTDPGIAQIKPERY